MGRGILSTLKIKQKGFCPKKGFFPSWKIYRRDSVHLVKMSGRDYIHVAKNTGGIMSTYTKMSRRDYVREGFCPTLLIYQSSRYCCICHLMFGCKITFPFNTGSSVECLLRGMGGHGFNPRP